MFHTTLGHVELMHYDSQDIQHKYRYKPPHTQHTYRDLHTDIHAYMSAEVCVSLSKGAMVYVSLHELLVESVEQLGVTKATLARAREWLEGLEWF